MYRRLDREPGLRKIHDALGLDGSHPFESTYMEKALSKLLPWEKRVIEKRYIRGRTVEQTSGSENIPIWAMESVESGIIGKLGNLCKYPWML